MLGRWVARDPVLLGEWEASRRLIEGLQRGAEGWKQIEGISVGGKKRERKLEGSPALPRWSWTVAMGVVLVALVGWANGWYSDWGGRTSQEIAMRPTGERAETRDGSLVRDGSVEREVLSGGSGLVDTLRQSLVTLHDRQETARDQAMQFVLRVDRDMLEEQKLFLGDMKATAQYFTQILPARTSRLFGGREPGRDL